MKTHIFITLLYLARRLDFLNCIVLAVRGVFLLITEMQPVSSQQVCDKTVLGHSISLTFICSNMNSSKLTNKADEVMGTVWLPTNDP